MLMCIYIFSTRVGAYPYECACKICVFVVRACIGSLVRACEVACGVSVSTCSFVSICKRAWVYMCRACTNVNVRSAWKLGHTRASRRRIFGYIIYVALVRRATRMLTRPWTCVKVCAGVHPHMYGRCHACGHPACVSRSRSKLLSDENLREAQNAFFDQMALRNQGAFYHVSIFADATTVSAPTFSEIMKHFAHLKGAENLDPRTLVWAMGLDIHFP